MLTIESSELEAKLQEQANARGLKSEEFATRLLLDFLRSDDAIDAATGALTHTNWSSTALHQERQDEKEREDAAFRKQFDVGV